MNNDDKTPEQIEEERAHFERMGYDDVDVVIATMNPETQERIESTCQDLQLDTREEDLIKSMIAAIYIEGKLAGVKAMENIITLNTNAGKMCRNCHQIFTNTEDIEYLKQSPFCLDCDKIASESN